MTTPRKRQRREPFPPKVDLTKSLIMGVSILKKAKVPFALCGSVAAWLYLPEHRHAFTRDVDFAVPHGHDLWAAEEARGRGYKVEELGIGGYGVHGSNVSVDFVSRRVYHADLFAEAVRAAPFGGALVSAGRFRVRAVPVEYLVAMKMLTFRAKDDEMVEDLAKLLTSKQVDDLKDIVSRFLPALYGRMRNILALAGWSTGGAGGDHEEPI